MHNLIEILHSLENKNENKDINSKYPYLIEEINFLVLRIKFSNNLQEANPHFDFLDKIQMTVTKLQNKLDINLPSNLARFVKDFGLLHDYQERERLLAAIKKDVFFYDPNYDAMILKYQHEITNSFPVGDLDAQLKFLHDGLMRLINKIKLCGTFNETSQYFESLEHLHHCLAMLSFKYDISLGESLNNFVRIFDRIDDLSERQRLYSEIRNNSYHV